MITVVVADDHYLVRQGVRALLDNAAGIQVVGEAENGEQAVQLVQELQPDVVVMDISMPEMDGIRATERIRSLQNHTRVVILSMYANIDLVEQALKKGATGYLLNVRPRRSWLSGGSRQEESNSLARQSREASEPHPDYRRRAGRSCVGACQSHRSRSNYLPPRK